MVSMYPSKAQLPISPINLNLESYKTLISNKRYLEILGNMLYLICQLLPSRWMESTWAWPGSSAPLCCASNVPGHWALPIRLPVHFLLKISMIRDLLPEHYNPTGLLWLLPHHEQWPSWMELWDEIQENISSLVSCPIGCLNSTTAACACAASSLVAHKWWIVSPLTSGRSWEVM